MGGFEVGVAFDVDHESAEGAGVAAHGVVDAAEAVKSDQNQCHGGLVAPAVRHGHLDARGQPGPVGQTSQ